MAEGGHVVEAPPTQPGPQLSRPLPLNSKRLTGAVLRQIARGLGVPGTASADEVRQVVEGKLGELGRDPRNTQVCWVEVEDGLKVTLKDADGVFLEVEPEESGAQEEEEEEQVEVEAGDVDALRQELEEVKAARASLEAELTTLRQKYEREKAKAKDLWSVNCAQLAEFDETLLEKEEEITQLRDQLAAAKRAGARHLAPGGSGGMRSELGEETRSTMSSSVKLPSRRGKAPPVEMFSGEDPEVRLNDWLPSLQRASQWNGWEQEERLIQLAGHLKGRALQEWNLLEEAQKDGYDEAVKSLRGQLDTGSKAMAAQDFRHLAQEGKEKVTDFIRRLEKTFCLAYGQESMSTETRDALLYGQLQEGLGYALMESPAVSGATGYQSLCVAAKNEERRQAALKKRKQYQSTTGGGGPAQSNPDAKLPGGGGMLAPERRGPPTRRCWNCDTIGHLAKDCRRPKRESFGSASSQKTPHTRLVHSGNSDMGPPASDSASVPPLVEDDPLRYLLSDSEEEAGVNQVRVTDKGSAHQQVKVLVAGVPLFGVVDTGADVTIMGGSAFKQVAAAARLHKRDFKPANKAAHNYDRKPFRLDGRLDLDVSFADHTMKTAVFVKMDAPEPLLLSEGVCRQLGIVVYHPEVKPRGKTSGQDTKTQVSAVRVQRVESVKLLPGPDRCVMAEVELSGNGVTGTLLLEPEPQFKREQGVVVPDVLVSPPSEGTTGVVLTNQSGFTQRLEAGTTLGTLEAVDWEEEVERQNDMVAAGVEGCCGDESSEDASVKVWMAGSEGVGDGLDRKHKLREMLKGQIGGLVLSVEEKEELCEMLEFDDVFSVEDGKRGETDLVEFSIGTGDAVLKRQPPRRVPFAVRKEVVPMFDVPEALLCGLLGITKLNTTAYHPQCNGMVERLNRTLKAMLRKHVTRFGMQWDSYLPGVLGPYRNSPRAATGEKPSFLLFGVDCRSPTEAALMPPTPLELTDVADYREELVLSLSSARKLAAAHIRAAQNRYKAVYDRWVRGRQHQVGDWVLLRFPQEESGRQRKLSRPWHGPYRVIEKRDPDITAVKVYFPEKGPIQVHQSRACPCPPKLPAGFYWYGGTCKSPGKVPAWVGRLVDEGRSLEQDAPTGGTEDAAEDTDTEFEDLGPEDAIADVEDGDTAVEEPDVDSDVVDAMTGPVEQIPEPPRRSTCTQYPLRATVCPPDRYVLLKFGTNFVRGESDVTIL